MEYKDRVISELLAIIDNLDKKVEQLGKLIDEQARLIERMKGGD